MAGALAALLARLDSFINHPPFKLAILVSGLYVVVAALRETHLTSGYSALFDPQSKFFPPNGQKSQAHTLHIIGRNDTIVSEGAYSPAVDKVWPLI